MRGIAWVELESGFQQGFGEDVAEMPQRPARHLFIRHDFQVNVLRHAPDETMRPAQGRAAAKHQPERYGVNRDNRRERLEKRPLTRTTGFTGT